MQEIFAQFPTRSASPSTIGGQIFDVRYHHTQHIVAVPEEYAAVPTTDLNSLQGQILEALFLFKHATADLLLRYLRFSPNSLRYLQKQIYAMNAEKKEDRFVEFLYPPKQKASRFGSAPYVVTLGQRGYAFLRERGKPVGRYRRSDVWVHKEYPLRHRLAVNEFLLKALLLEDTEPNIHLFDHRHEQYWNANSLKVELPDVEKPVGLSPDLLLAFETYTPPDKYRFLPEINLTEMWRKEWEKKVVAYRYCMPAYRGRFATSVLTTVPVMVASSASFPRTVYAKLTEQDKKERVLEATSRNKRMLSLLHWTEQTLEKLNMRHQADLFSFSTAPLDEISPTELFFGSHWIIPFSDTLRPLISLRKAGVS